MSSSGSEYRSCLCWEEYVGREGGGNKTEGRINGVASQANSAFTNISSSDSPIPSGRNGHNLRQPVSWSPGPAPLNLSTSLDFEVRKKTSHGEGDSSIFPTSTQSLTSRTPVSGDPMPYSNLCKLLRAYGAHRFTKTPSHTHTHF